MDEEVEEEINEERGRSISSTLQSRARKVTRHWDQRSPGLTREATPLPLSESLLCIIMQRRCVIQDVCKCLMVIF